MEALTDASFRDREGSTFTGGYIIKLFGDVIAWRSHKIAYVSLSTCEAEYLTMSDACRELISIDKATRYVIGKTLFPVIIWCDNQSSKDCTEMFGSHKLKSFDQNIRDIQKELEEREETGKRKSMPESHGDFIKQCVEEAKVKVLWISTDKNLAGIMTKPLPNSTYVYLRDNITSVTQSPVDNN